MTLASRKESDEKKTKITHGVVICRLYPNLLFLKRSLRAWQHGHERLSRGYYIIP